MLLRILLVKEKLSNITALKYLKNFKVSGKTIMNISLKNFFRPPGLTLDVVGNLRIKHIPRNIVRRASNQYKIFLQQSFCISPPKTKLLKEKSEKKLIGRSLI